MTALALPARFARTPVAFWTALFAAALAAAALLAVSVGAADASLLELWRASTDPAHRLHAVLWDVRIPRVATGACVGGALAVAGALMQTAVRNPLADPGLFGVTAGAGLAALIAIVAFPGHTVLLPLFAFGGALAAVSGVLLAASAGPARAGVLRVVLSGVAIQALLFAGIALVTFLYADRAPAFVAFTVGSLNGSGWLEVGLVLVPTLLGLALALGSARWLDLLLLDDESARGVGLGVHGARAGAAAVAALLAAGAVSVAGLVGFVGLVVPNGVRILVGPAHRALVPTCLLAGGALVILADTLARLLTAPVELPVGALLAMIGAPSLLLLLWRKVA